MQKRQEEQGGALRKLNMSACEYLLLNNYNYCGECGSEWRAFSSFSASGCALK